MSNWPCSWSEKRRLKRLFKLSEHLLGLILAPIALIALQNLQLWNPLVYHECDLLAILDLIELSIDAKQDLLAFLFVILLDIDLERTSHLAIPGHFKVNVVCDALVTHQLHLVVVFALLQA